MATAIEKVSGIGPSTSILLADHGINSAEDLAAKRVGDLAAIKGFNTIRAAQVIDAARQLTSAIMDNSVVQVAPSDQENKEKKDKKKKKDKQKKKKAPSGEKSKAAKNKKKSAPKEGKDKKKSAGSKKKSSKKK